MQIHVSLFQHDIVQWCILVHDQEEQRPEQVCVLLKRLGPLEKVIIPIIPVALTPLWIGHPGVETPDQAYGLMKFFDS